jgi:DNA-binding MarR family transcriptional regulator
MQRLADASIETTSASECSAQLIEVAPMVMRRIRSNMRRWTMPGLSIVQFRTMTYLWRHPGASLSDVSAFLGLTLPSTSKLVQRLVLQKVITRRTGTDRRRVKLSVTEQGLEALTLARQETQRHLTANLESMNPKELATISVALQLLERAFSHTGDDVSIH